MRFLATLRSLAANFLRPTQRAMDTNQEPPSHIELRADDRERSGPHRDEVERRAHRVWRPTDEHGLASALIVPQRGHNDAVGSGGNVDPHATCALHRSARAAA